MNPKVDKYFEKANKWNHELISLRSIVLETGLNEELKWYQPCYTYNNKNIALISAFKDYCVLSFLKGTLLKDPKGILSKPGANSQSVRFLKFTSVHEVKKLKPSIKSYLKESMRNEDAGLKVKFKKITEHKLPKELEEQFKNNPELKKAFKALTPGRQRGYILFFSAPKHSSTRISRIEKSIHKIYEGMGLNDR